MPRKEPTTGSISAQAQQSLVSDGIENFELPKSIVTKIARSAIPENAKLQKETILSLVKGSTVFVNYLAATAHEVALSKQHKSISATDVLRALEVLELGDLVDNLQNELTIYRELAKTDKSKKGTSSIINPPVRGKSTTHAATASAPPVAAPGPTIKIKVKDRPVNLTSPFTSAPIGAPAPPTESISTRHVRMDIDDDDSKPPDAEAEEADVDEEDVMDDADVDDVEEPLQDTLAQDEEELRKDANALEPSNKVDLGYGSMHMDEA